MYYCTPTRITYEFHENVLTIFDYQPYVFTDTICVNIRCHVWIEISIWPRKQVFTPFLLVFFLESWILAWKNYRKLMELFSVIFREP